MYLHIVSWEPEGCYNIQTDVPLRTRRGLSLHKVYGDSTLLALNWTSLNSDSALLALNWTSLNSDSALLVLNGTSLNSDSALLVLNGTSLNSDSALLALNWVNQQYRHRFHEVVAQRGHFVKTVTICTGVVDVSMCVCVRTLVGHVNHGGAPGFSRWTVETRNRRAPYTSLPCCSLSI